MGGCERVEGLKEWWIDGAGVEKAAASGVGL